MPIPHICVVDDEPIYSEGLRFLLDNQGFHIHVFSSADKFLAECETLPQIDLIISDINMPGRSGYELCKIVRQDTSNGRIPIILITGSDPNAEKATGLDAGADDFIGKPFSSKDLIAKVRSLLDIRAVELKTKKELDVTKKFISPNIASLLALEKYNELLKPHRAEVTVLFTDLRRFTSFSENAEPEEVLEVLGQYYTAVGNAAIKYLGTLGHLAGDGIMVFFNDPEPVANHMEVAVRMALEARGVLQEQRKRWHDRQYDIDFGIGISEGYATIGGIGFDRFSQYSVIGTVSNFASRLCHIANEGQILISRRFMSRLNPNNFQTEEVGEVALKGIDKPVSVFNVVGTK